MYGGGYRSLEVFEEKLRNFSHIAFFSNLLKQICANPISFHTVPFTGEERIPRMLISVCNRTWQNMK